MGYFTKSLFTLALECPTKLYYQKKSEYPSTKQENEFLNALAEGGFQVGALARSYYPDGHHIKTLVPEEAIRQTSDLLQKENVTIFEAAIKFDNFFIRADIIRKSGKQIQVFEVKSKSYYPDQDNLLTKSNYIDSKWLPYLYDVAFQTWVIENAFPHLEVEPYLMLADKSARTSVDGLNQKFRIVRDNARSKIRKSGDVSLEGLGNPILIRVPAREYVEMIWTGRDRELGEEDTESQLSFVERAREYAGYFLRDERYPIAIGKKCRDCEFNVKHDVLEPGQKSGFRECWKTALGWSDKHFEKPLVFDLWDFRQSQECLDRGIYFMEDIPVEDFLMEINREGQLEYKSWRAERQDLQIQKMCHEQDGKENVKPELFTKIEKWNFPLHFIDFETSMVTIPFSKGRRPYEQIAFQFSCHTVREDGRIEHDEWIEKKLGKFPNFDFIVELKRILNNDSGTILRYSHYENTVLRQIQNQLIEAIESQSDGLPENAEELIRWIDTVTEWKEYIEIDGKVREIKRAGERNMADMWDLVRRYYYHPKMGGSNSIKAVLPAVLASSDFLKNKYSKPYSSKNYSDMIWWQLNDVGLPKDPYQLLPPLFEDIEALKGELFLESDTISEGGSAMVAYAKMQFTEMSKEEREAIIKGLLKYCELDTLAMVMIWEHWNSLMA